MESIVLTVLLRNGLFEVWQGTWEEVVHQYHISEKKQNYIQNY